VKNAVEDLKSKMTNLIKGKKKRQKMKFTLAFQVDYEVDPDTYTDTDPIKMAAEDTASASEDPLVALQGMAELPGARVRVKCEAVQTAGEKAGLVVEEEKRRALDS
jgi:hypothetical protein